MIRIKWCGFISCSHLNEASVRIRQEFGDRLCLHMREKFDYGDALNCKVSYVPPDKPGRGLYKWDDEPLEFHAAMYCPDLGDRERSKRLKEQLQEFRERSGNATGAMRLPVYRQDASYEEFSAQFKAGAGKIEEKVITRDRRSGLRPKAGPVPHP